VSTLTFRRTAVSAWVLVLWAAACGKESSNDDACTRGNEGCVCYPNQTCNPGLECLSSLCVSRNGTGGSGAQAGNDDSGAGAGPDAGGTGGSTSSAGAPSSDGGANRGGTGGRASGGASSLGGTDAGGADGGATQETGGTLSAGAGSGGKTSGGAVSGGTSATGGTLAQGGSSGKGGTGGTLQGTGGTTGGSAGKAGAGGSAQGGSSGAAGACASGGAASLFFDNFECGTTAWTPTVTGAFALVMDGSNTYTRGTLANSLALSSAGSSSWANVRVEVRVKALSFGAAASPSLSYVALYGHFIDTSNYHAIAWQADGTVAIRERTNGGGSDSYNQNTILTLGQWYTLAIEFSGTTTRILVDGTLISSTIGATAATGRIALSTFNATARFDDVRVTILP
jgi:hypothetical protein